MDEFLIDRVPRTWQTRAKLPQSLVPADMFVQEVPNGLEVVLARAQRLPSNADLRAAWSARKDGRHPPVLLVASYPTADGTRVALCGPTGDKPVVYTDVEVSQAERLADAALSEPSHHAATRLLMAALPEMHSPFPGLRNTGLLASQELKSGVPLRRDWATACKQAAPLLACRGRALVEALGFEVETLSINASVLTVAGRREAVAVFCDDNEPFEAPSGRFDNTSPVSRALALADREHLDWVVLTRASEIRLYSARPEVGVGRKGRAETFVELNLALTQTDQAGYLQLLFSAKALGPGGSLHDVLSDSERYAADLAARLRERIYHQTVPALARAVAARLTSGRGDNTVSETDFDHAYEQVMVILFRLLFVAYAEDRDLLPFRTNDTYASHSQTRIAQRLAKRSRRRTSVAVAGGAAGIGTVRGDSGIDSTSTGWWDEVKLLWRAVNRGNPDWSVPAYNGGLFSDDQYISPAGAAIERLELTNAEFEPALAAALVDEGPDGVIGPIDFRSLSVREFGTIYEGLLESKLSVAPDDLVVKRIKGADQYLPATAADPDEAVAVRAGEVYFHNRSGVRKSTGSYFTKPFAVEHLLDHALEPALDAHLDRLDHLREAGDDAAVAETFFDFRCADIAMGSGHFLVAALDRIESKLAGWLSLHPVPAITAELDRLSRTALAALSEPDHNRGEQAVAARGSSDPGASVEASSLLRRQIARHCIYGVDKNKVAVELTRCAIWIHTFVAGLPLSFLDHNLIHGDSLTGVGSLDDAVAALEPSTDAQTPSLFRDQLTALLGSAEDALRRLAQTSDATKREIKDARDAHADAHRAVSGARAVFDVVTAHRAGTGSLPENLNPAVFSRLAESAEVREHIERLRPVHLPAAFPEVFLRDNPGFDCLLGNPPWEKVVVDREVWWGMHLPGVRSLPVARRRARIDALESQRPDLAEEFEREHQRAEALKHILRSTFSRLGSGQTDLYKAFAWANLALCRLGGTLGIVLPRSAVADAGMANWRREVVGVNGASILQDRTGQDRTGQDRTGQDRTGQDRTGQDRTGQDRTGQDRTAATISTVINHKGWVFDGVHHSYTVVLAVVRRTSARPAASTPSSGRSTVSTPGTRSRCSPSTGLHRSPNLGGGFDDTSGIEGDEPFVAIYPGPARSLDHFRELVDGKPELVPVAELERWSNSAAFPQIPSRAAFRVWRRMKRHPRFDGGSPPGVSAETAPPPPRDGGSARFRATTTPPQTGTDSSTTTDAELPSGRRIPRNARPSPIRERRWSFRPVREFDATNDRHLFLRDDGAAAACSEIAGDE